MPEAPAPLGKRDPELPILPGGKLAVVPPAALPGRLPEQRAGGDEVAAEQPIEVEVRNLDHARAQTEGLTVAVDHPDVRLGLEEHEPRLDEAGPEAVVGVERQDVAPAGAGDARIPGTGQSDARQVEDVEADLPQPLQHLERARLARAVVDEDELAARRGRYDARHRLDQELAEVAAGNDDRHQRLDWRHRERRR